MNCKNCGFSEKLHTEEDRKISKVVGEKVPCNQFEQKDPKQVAKGKKNKLKGARFELKVRKDLEAKGWIVDKWTNNVDLGGQDKTVVKIYNETDEAIEDFCEALKQTKKDMIGTVCGIPVLIDKPKMHPARSNRFNMRSTGFPDFIAIRHVGRYDPRNKNFYMPPSSNFHLTVEDEDNWTEEENKKYSELVKKENEEANKKCYETYEVIGVEAKMDGKLDKIEKEKCRWLLDNKIFGKIWIAQKGEKRGEIKYVEFQ